MKAEQRIYWTEANRKQIAELMFEQWKVDPFATPRETYNAIKPKLPENIRRTILAFTVGVVGPLQKLYADKVREHIAGNAGGESVPQIVEVVREVMPEPFTALAKIPTKYLAAELFERLSHRFEPAAPAANGTAKPHREPPPIILPEEPRKPRIAIIGLFAEQFSFVQEKLTAAGKADLCELKFYDKDKRTTTIQADYAIVQRHSRHHWFDKARTDLADKKHVYFVDGGIEKTTQRVFDILSQCHLR